MEGNIFKRSFSRKKRGFCREKTLSVQSTPLLELIDRFPLVAGRLFYKMMTVDHHYPFDTFKKTQINYAYSVDFDFSYFDNIQERGEIKIIFGD